MTTGAKFSECGKYRFYLWRTWNYSKPFLMLIGLNPSTANADTDDPTIRRIKTLAESNGYGGIYMTNLFPFITPFPDRLIMDKITENDMTLMDIEDKTSAICFCWGNFDVKGRDRSMKILFPDALCFGKNKNGSPKHPLYLKSDTKLIKF